MQDKGTKEPSFLSCFRQHRLSFSIVQQQEIQRYVGSRRSGGFNKTSSPILLFVFFSNGNSTKLKSLLHIRSTLGSDEPDPANGVRDRVRMMSLGFLSFFLIVGWWGVAGFGSNGVGWAMKWQWIGGLAQWQPWCGSREKWFYTMMRMVQGFTSGKGSDGDIGVDDRGMMN